MVYLYLVIFIFILFFVLSIFSLYTIQCNYGYNYLFSIYIAGKFGKFGKLPLFCQTKTIQISTYNYNLLAESIHSPNFFCQMFKMCKFAKLLPCQTFPLYSTCSMIKSMPACHTYYLHCILIYWYIYSSTSTKFLLLGTSVDDCSILEHDSMTLACYV